MKELMIRAGLIAARVWDINPISVSVMMVPEIAGTQIIVRGKEPLQDDYISIIWQEDIVELQRFRHTDGWEIWMSYSKICDVLVVRI